MHPGLGLFSFSTSQRLSLGHHGNQVTPRGETGRGRQAACESHHPARPRRRPWGPADSWRASPNPRGSSPGLGWWGKGQSHPALKGTCFWQLQTVICSWAQSQSGPSKQDHVIFHFSPEAEFLGSPGGWPGSPGSRRAGTPQRPSLPGSAAAAALTAMALADLCLAPLQVGVESGLCSSQGPP